MSRRGLIMKGYGQETQLDAAALAEMLGDPDASGVVYPDSDGTPMGETGFHVHASLHLYSALRQFFRDDPEVYVAANMFLYYEEGNPQAVRAPDVMVIRGVRNYERRTFKLWKEGTAPCVIFEITSKSSVVEDLMAKGMLYASLGVREYFLFDPLHDYLDKRLLGFSLEGKNYLPMTLNDRSELVSQELDIIMKVEHSILRLINPETNKPIPGLEEAVIWAEQEAERADQEAERAEQEAQRAEQEAQRAEQEAQRAEQERRRAEVAEAELAKLRARLNEQSS